MLQGTGHSQYSQHEGSCGVVLSVFVADLGARSTAEVVLGDGQKLVQAPVEYLWPTRPSCEGEHAVGVFGRLQGRVFRVTRIQNHMAFLVDLKSVSQLETENISKLCKWTKI